MNAQTEIRLLVSSGDGPAECRRAVTHVVEQMKREATQARVSLDIAVGDTNGKCDPASAMVTFAGANSKKLAQRWIGTILWICNSPFRPNHKRRNWFAGVFLLPNLSDTEFSLEKADLKFETFRAGGPGGQHQNTTNSAVRVTHAPSGTVALSRDERSQHRNKQTAVRRLADKMLLNRSLALAAADSELATLHKKLERGNPVRCFKGTSFREVKSR